jgi:ABC-type sugar transport system ATPase subunit
MNITSFVRKIDVRTPYPDQSVGNLSGGNQQKHASEFGLNMAEGVPAPQGA